MRLDPRIELRQLGVDFSERDDKALRVECPFHDDSTPSCDVFLDDASYVCHACKAQGRFAQLVAKLTDRPQHIVQSELEARYGGDESPIDPDQVERYHRAIWSETGLLAELAKRCVGDFLIRQFRLGADNGKITIPITDASGQYVNVRRYAPGQPASAGAKFTSMRGRGKRLRLYPFGQLKYDKLLLCGGEIKALASLGVLNQHGIGAVCLSGGGEKDWSPALEPFFRGKKVCVCDDIDAVGRSATELKCARLQGAADWVGAVELPLSLEQYPTGDVNDFLRASKNPGGDLLALLRGTPKYVPKAEAERLREASASSEEPTPVSIADVSTAEFVGKRVSVRVNVSAMDQSVYYVPRQVKIACGKDEDFCPACPVFLSRDPTFEVGCESSSILAIMDSRRSALREEVMAALKIPTQCPSADIEVLKNYKVIETRVQRAMTLTDHASDKHVFPAVVVGDDEIDLNETYEFTGRPLPHPKTQAATVIVSQVRAVADALSTFDAGDVSDLLVFQPDSWTLEAMKAKLAIDYEFYERNVTRIYNRLNLHRFIDLVYHSVLGVRADGENVKGWLELLVIGDSSQGKSRAFESMSEYLGLGVSVDCANASTAGLLGGLENIDGKWWASWGVMPTHDRRLVHLEELKELPQDVFKKLTNTRSTGRAHISKIKKGSALARTRLIANTNPHGNQTMDAYAYGVKAIPDVVWKPEDIRRFDAAVFLNKNDIDPALLNVHRPPVAVEPHTQEAARRLVLWSWTRTMDQVLIDDETYETIRASAIDFCDRYSDGIPLVDRGSMRHKLLRFATAAACKTFSCEGDCVRVRPCHVQYVIKLLDEEYSSSGAGYLEYSKHDKLARYHLDEGELRKEMGRVQGAQLLASRLLNAHTIDKQDFCDWCAWSIDEASMFLSSLVRCNALMRHERGYRKTPPAIPILREIHMNGSGHRVPEHVELDTGKY